jgi:hypothetical protein
MNKQSLMQPNESPRPASPLAKRRIADILALIREYQLSHGGKFPTTRSPFPRPRGSWNAIDRALRHDAIVQCEHFTQLKAALLRRGLTPTLARLNPSYIAPHNGPRRFADILQVIRESREQHGGRFPLRTDPFAVRGHSDTWIAIDSALTTGAIADCPLWIAHREKMARLGVKPSLASLHPHYRPVRRERRTIASIQAAVVAYMAQHGGKLPNQRAAFPSQVPADSWKAICKALRLGNIEPDGDWREFCARIEESQQKPSLFTFMACYRQELHSMFALAPPAASAAAPITVPRARSARATKRPVQFAALVSQLFRPPSLAGAGAAAEATSSHRAPGRGRGARQTAG